MFKDQEAHGEVSQCHYSGNYSLGLNYRRELQLTRDLCVKKT